MTQHMEVCTICHEQTDVRNINLFVTGSEGLDVCHECEKAIVGIVMVMANIARKSRIHGVMAVKKRRGA